MTSAKAKRCVCGRSKTLPLCDGSHESPGWTCSPEEVDVLPYVFVASSNLQNLADRLAHRFGGASIQTAGEKLQCRRLVVVADGHDIDRLQDLRGSVDADSVVVMGVGPGAGALQWAFEDAVHLTVDEEFAPLLWKRAEAALLSGSAQLDAVERPRVFLSHSVRDEAAIIDVVDALRDQFEIPIFVCADSIRAGDDWYAEIHDHLARCDVFVFVVSHSANASVFCAFETGVATGLGKPVRVVSLDGHVPPAHLQHIQSADIPRLLQRKPWLTEADALLEGLLSALGGDRSDA